MGDTLAALALGAAGLSLWTRLQANNPSVLRSNFDPQTGLASSVQGNATWRHFGYAPQLAEPRDPLYRNNVPREAYGEIRPVGHVISKIAKMRDGALHSIATAEGAPPLPRGTDMFSGIGHQRSFARRDQYWYAEATSPWISRNLTLQEAKQLNARVIGLGYVD